ncbi:MAG: ABC transporter ATP-binding protein, partial [Deltaproteobacteria bacterium]|nr:ABC transporter ATP-binding protein [Deltaproteobacteria bacterium]
MIKLLEVNNLKIGFQNRKGISVVIDGVSLHLYPGEIISLVGESGSGKSITMMSTVQVLPPTGRILGGEVILDENGENILNYPPEGAEIQNIRGGKIGFIFQEPMTCLNPVLTVGFQIQETIMLHSGLGKEDARAKTIEMMKLVNIPDAEERYKSYPQNFSGGMRQRIMIAMALASEPDVLIADEATTALDVTTQAQLLEMISKLAKKTGISVIIVTHNLGIVARYAERIYVMYSGNIVETADTFTLFKNPEHPYTRGLLKAIPRLNDPEDRVLIPIEGLPQDPASKPAYCPFFDRCGYRSDKCKENPSPRLRQLEDGHQIACWLTQEEKEIKRLKLESKEEKRRPLKKIESETCLEVNGLNMTFPIYSGFFHRKTGNLKVLEDITFDVHKGETLGIVGESGCGKTTLARCITRVYEPQAGKILFFGKDITHLKKKALEPIRPRVSLIFQDPFSSLDPRQNAGFIVGESLKIHKLIQSMEEYDRRVRELFQLVGLDPDLRDRFPHEFSGGQRQRIGVARALSSNPDIIICDEPVSAVDVSIQAQIINLLEELQSELGLTYLFIAHDLAVVKHLSDRVMVTYLGRVMEIAHSTELYDNPMHPYTKALLSSVPIVDPEAEIGREYVPMRGEVPSVMNRPAGCPFSDRCDYTTERCRREIPRVKELSPNHFVHCFLY